MGFKRAIGAPTKLQKKRQDLIREFGCIACYLEGHPHTPTEIQHLNDCGRNISQDHTIGLCCWHHRGVLPMGLTTSSATLLLGPSFSKSKREFEARYGSEEELLQLTNRMIGWDDGEAD